MPCSTCPPEREGDKPGLWESFALPRGRVRAAEPDGPELKPQLRFLPLVWPEVRLLNLSEPQFPHV